MSALDPHVTGPEKLDKLAVEFDTDIKAESSRTGQFDVPGANDATLTALVANYTVNLERFWLDRTSATEMRQMARDAGRAKVFKVLRQRLDAAGVGDDAFSRLLATWFRETSPFVTTPDYDAISSAGEDLRDAIAKIRTQLATLDASDKDDFELQGVLGATLTVISRQIRDRAQALRDNKTVTAFTLDERAKECVTRIDGVVKYAQVPIDDLLANVQKAFRAGTATQADLQRVTDLHKDALQWASTARGTALSGHPERVLDNIRQAFDVLKTLVDQPEATDQLSDALRDVKAQLTTLLSLLADGRQATREKIEDQAWEVARTIEGCLISVSAITTSRKPAYMPMVEYQRVTLNALLRGAAESVQNQFTFRVNNNFFG